MIDRRTVLASVGVAGAGAVGVGTLKTGAAAPAPVRTVDVRDFGATGDGQTDDTDAFNRACQAAADWSEALCYAIHVPSGRYRIDGSVYVRKGQTLFGDGHATYIDARRARASTFVLGRRAGGDRGEPDPGGAPVRLSGLHAMGGAAASGFVATDAQGFSITDLFLTAVGIGIEIGGGADTWASDGIVRDVFIDQCLQGFLIGKAQNLNISTVNIYRSRFAISIGDQSHDIILNGVSAVYTENVALTLTGRVANIIVANSTFVSNAQHDSFLANVLVRISEGDALFSGCTFRNWPGTAIMQDQPGDVGIAFAGCVFDGGRSTSNYDWSKTSRVLEAGSAGRFSFEGCTFRVIRGPIARMAAGEGRLRLSGGVVETSDERRLVVDDGFAGRITVRDVDGFAPSRSSPGRAETLLPLWPGAAWRVTVDLGDAGGFAEEAVVRSAALGDPRPAARLARGGGWRTAGDRGLSLVVADSADGPVLSASIAADRPERARLTAETVF